MHDTEAENRQVITNQPSVDFNKGSLQILNSNPNITGHQSKILKHEEIKHSKTNIISQAYRGKPKSKGNGL